MGTEFDSNSLKLMQLQPDGVGLIDWEQICTDYVCTRVGAYALGICCCAFLLPFFTDTPESRCCYCLLSVILLITCETLPCEAAAILPLFLLAIFDLPTNIERYLGPAVLTELASTAVVFYAEQSALFTRVALWFLRRCGTRHRCILLSSITIGIVCSFTVLDSGTTVLILAAVLEASVRALQNESIQAIHQRALFDKATQRLPAFRRQQLANILWPPHDSSSSSSESGSESESATPATSTEEYLWDGFMYPVDKSKQPPWPLHIPPKAPLPPPGRSALKDPSKHSHTPKAAPKQTTILTEGGVVIPGESSPLPKPKYKAGEVKFQSSLQTIMKQGVLADVMYWNNRRYLKIYGNLLSSAAIATVVTAIPALHTNTANRYFLNYFRKRFEEDVVSPLTWYGLLAPVLVAPSFAFWTYVTRYTLRKFDAAQDRHSVAAINVALEKEEQRLGQIRPWTYVSVVLLLIWIVKKGVEYFYISQGDMSAHRELSLDYLIVVAMYSVSTSMHLVSPADEVGPRLPWRALLIYGGSACVASTIKEVAFVPWVASQFPEPGSYRFPAQMVLTVGAALLTEVISNEDTLAILLPVAVDMAIAMPCNPLYFALPITVASSTSLLLPMSSFAIAYVYDRLGMTPWDLLLCGLLLKSLVVCSVLFVMSTIGAAVFHWQRIPSWINRNGTFNITDI
ncbi:solute carrier family 13 member 2-like [Ornithodoros turicata]|uniref:solute carrier family 13 member 2-like n=1 Tax=Ornithodoros turicata TaxID=34597 RepID=UPI00313951A0